MLNVVRAILTLENPAGASQKQTIYVLGGGSVTLDNRCHNLRATGSKVSVCLLNFLCAASTLLAQYNHSQIPALGCYEVALLDLLTMKIVSRCFFDGVTF